MARVTRVATTEQQHWKQERKTSIRGRMPRMCRINGARMYSQSSLYSMHTIFLKISSSFNPTRLDTTRRTSSSLMAPTGSPRALRPPLQPNVPLLAALGNGTRVLSGSGDALSGRARQRMKSPLRRHALSAGAPFKRRRMDSDRSCLRLTLSAGVFPYLSTAVSSPPARSNRSTVFVAAHFAAQ